jgi:hypothetical protein
MESGLAPMSSSMINLASLPSRPVATYSSPYSSAASSIILATNRMQDCTDFPIAPAYVTFLVAFS